MKIRMTFMVVTLFAVMLVFMACDKRSNEPLEPEGNGNGDGFRSVTAQGITLQWKTDTRPLNALLMVRVSAPTTGWVAAGFDPTNRMQNANFIIGYVTGGSVFIRDEFGTGPTTHQADVDLGGRDDVGNKMGTEQGGTTEIGFTIPLSSGDAYDRNLAAGETYPVLLAYGPDGADDYTSVHQTRTLVNIQL
jgi:hypothetical protein